MYSLLFLSSKFKQHQCYLWNLCFFLSADPFTPAAWTCQSSGSWSVESAERFKMLDLQNTTHCSLPTNKPFLKHYHSVSYYPMVYVLPDSPREPTNTGPLNAITAFCTTTLSQWYTHIMRCDTFKHTRACTQWCIDIMKSAGPWGSI